MPKDFSAIPTIILLVLFAVIWILILVRWIRNRLAPVKTVHATVVDKFKSSANLRRSGTFSRDQYTIVFSTGEKKLSFTVSEFSYNGYKLKETGKLTYKGNRLINFE